MNTLGIGLKFIPKAVPGMKKGRLLRGGLPFRANQLSRLRSDQAFEQSAHF
jgi:hypothetical protein